ncbi:MAG: bifunctional 3,4-dihydroxy-2-butanone-4-phosphate synthase/GTP cyclohydrolase II, partial [Acidobacteria bacterium]
VAELIRYRLRTERFIQKIGETTLPTRHGNVRMIVFESAFDQQTHIALVRGNIEDGEDVLVRVQTHCLTGHVFGSPACHCHEQMDRAMEMIANAGRGVLLYLYEMGRSR